jgi:hypothetical protein
MTSRPEALGDEIWLLRLLLLLLLFSSRYILQGAYWSLDNYALSTEYESNCLCRPFHARGLVARTGTSRFVPRRSVTSRVVQYTITAKGDDRFLFFNG